jgi:hypothetical protein
LPLALPSFQPGVPIFCIEASLNAFKLETLQGVEVGALVNKLVISVSDLVVAHAGNAIDHLARFRGYLRVRGALS